MQSTKRDVGTVVKQDGKFYSKVVYCSTSGKQLCCLSDMNGNIIDATCTGNFLTGTDTGTAAPRPAGFEQTPPRRNPDANFARPGLLDSGSGFGSQGPASTGSPVAPASPSAPRPSFQ